VGSDEISEIPTLGDVAGRLRICGKSLSAFLKSRAPSQRLCGRSPVAMAVPSLRTDEEEVVKEATLLKSAAGL